jgi:hypothetical protein
MADRASRTKHWNRSTSAASSLATSSESGFTPATRFEGTRLLAGFGAPGARELHFFIAEEGIAAAAYVVISIVDDLWTE